MEAQRNLSARRSTLITRFCSILDLWRPSNKSILVLHLMAAYKITLLSHAIHQLYELRERIHLYALAHCTALYMSPKALFTQLRCKIRAISVRILYRDWWAICRMDVAHYPQPFQWGLGGKRITNLTKRPPAPFWVMHISLCADIPQLWTTPFDLHWSLFPRRFVGEINMQKIGQVWTSLKEKEMCSDLENEHLLTSELKALFLILHFSRRLFTR